EAKVGDSFQRPFRLLVNLTEPAVELPELALDPAHPTGKAADLALSLGHPFLPLGDPGVYRVHLLPDPIPRRHAALSHEERSNGTQRHQALKSTVHRSSFCSSLAVWNLKQA